MKRKRTKLKEKESDIQKAILQWLHLNNYFAWSNKTQGTYDPTKRIFRRNTTTVGAPDILGVLNCKYDSCEGRLLALEVKTKTGKLTEAQEHFLKSIHNKGGVSAVVRSVYDVEKLLLYHN